MSIVRLRGWLDQCLHSHKSCSKQKSEQNDNTRPSRLLHIANLTRGSANGIRLIETESRHYAYACLSHRWDGIIHQLKTTTANYNDAREFIDLDTLPANFREAIWVARKLQIDYMWIDSICIIQDGDGGKDLNRELAKMGHIYRGSFLTIAAVSSATADGGCFRSDIEKDMCLQILDHSLRPIIIGARILDRQGRPNTLENFQLHYPLLSRGWVLQERLLSSRLVECNYGELAFECLESDHCECGSNIAPHGAPSQKTLAMPASYRSQLYSQSQPGTTMLLSTWRTIISRYMQHELTQPTDVLPAIGGIAQAMSISLGYTYIAAPQVKTSASQTRGFFSSHMVLGVCIYGSNTWAHATKRVKPHTLEEQAATSSGN
ncbi:unnamed protein product [Clonostachys byssicola]|uniref:Heterokaryon incompatibility domain-containing protein n=1 Tax=Clonostachys byssicola TaxID=160290 RepID=A0A9N9UND4_9HYPO|nr:unnamed protein product [Clonostachys byssicola]